MADPMEATCAALADKLGMLPSEFKRRANKWDVIQMLAWDRTQDKDWQTRYERDKQISESREMTPEEKAAALFRGMG